MMDDLDGGNNSSMDQYSPEPSKFRVKKDLERDPLFQTEVRECLDSLERMPQLR